MSVVSSETMVKRPASAVGRRRPVCEYAQKAALLSGSFRFKVRLYQCVVYRVLPFHYIKVCAMCMCDNFNKYSVNIFVAYESIYIKETCVRYLLDSR